MAKKNTISQLDLVLLGRRGITARLGNVEGQVKRLTTGSGGVVEEAAMQDLRPNLLTNTSFEFFDRGSTKPQDWIVDGTGLVSVGSSGVDGTNSMRLPAGSMARQLAAAGTVVPQSSVVLSVAAKTDYAGQKISLGIGHVPGGQNGAIMRLDLDGNLIQTDDVPADGNWYRFYRSFILNGGNVAEAQIAQAGSGTVEIDAVKLEKEDGVAAWLEPTAYISADWGAATHIRNLAADNIVTGTLVVGGSISSNPRISVKDENDIEIVVIGDPIDGYYGIEIKGVAGLKVSGAGSVSITGGGAVEVSGGGSVKVQGGGAVDVEGGNVNVTDGFVNVTGSGGIVVSDGGGLTILGGGSALISGDLNIGGTTTLGGTATIGGNLLMGTGGLFRIGGATGKRILWAASGMEAYDAADNRRMFLDIDAATWRFFGENSVVMEGDGSLKAGELAWVDSAGFWAVDTLGNAAFGVSGLDAHLWGGIVLDKGDVLLGNNSNYVWWDASASKLKMTGDLSAAGGKVTADDAGLTIEQGTGSTSQLKWKRSDATLPNSYISANWGGSASGQSQLTLLTQNPLNNSNITVQNWAAQTGSAWFCWVGDDYGGVAHTTKLEVYSKGSGANNGMVFTDGALQVGGAVGTYQPAGTISATGDIKIGGSLYPGNGSGRFGSWDGTSLYASSNLVLAGSLFPGGQSSYYITYWGSGGHITNGHFVAGANIYPNNQATTALQYSASPHGTPYNGIGSTGNLWASGAVVATDWFRSVNGSGWYNQTYGGGIWMQDSTWVRVYGGKGFLTENVIELSYNNPTIILNNTGSGLRSNIRFTSGGSGKWQLGTDFQVNGGQDFYIYDEAASAGRMHIGAAGNMLLPNKLMVGAAFGNAPSWTLHLGLDSAAKPNGGSWINSSSDIRTKTVDSEYEYGLEAVRKLRLVRYTYNGLGGTEAGLKGVGFVAQEAREVIPEMVLTRMAKLHPEDEHETELLSLSNDPAIYATMKAVQEMADIIDQLRAEIAELRGSN